jgi:hypothetical protein
MTTLVPAYGRDYRSAKAVKEDWKSGKDFLIADFFSPWDGKPMNIDQAEKGSAYLIRYKGLAQICKVTV